MEQKYLNIILENNKYNSKKLYNEIFELLLNLDSNKISKLDVNTLFKNLKFDLTNGDDIDYDVLMGIISYFPSYEKEIIKDIENCKNTSLLVNYIINNKLNSSKITMISKNAIKAILVNKNCDMNNILLLKNYLKDNNLFDTVRKDIVCSGDIELITYAALSFDTTIINKIFGDEEKMYMYLSFNSFADEEETTFILEALIKVSNLKKDVLKQNKNIDTKIKKKKLSK